MTFGEKLRNARKKMKLTQKELASKIGAKHNSISNWENDQNKPDPDTIQTLCWVLNVTPNYFFSNEDISSTKEINNNFTEEEKLLLTLYNNLNKNGQTILMANAEFLNSQLQYKKCDTISEQEIR